LGLSLSYDILVKGHDGTIVIDSREHEYTTFVISLPLK
jgi:two-component system NtrC family sensor kinase